MTEDTEGGGSYVRQKDGSLKLVERTKPIENEAVEAAKAIEDASAAPAPAPASAPPASTPKKGA